MKSEIITRRAFFKKAAKKNTPYFDRGIHAFFFCFM